VTSDSTPSPNFRSTAGIDCPRTKLMPNQWFQKLPTEKTTWDGLLRGLGVPKSNGCTNLVQWLEIRSPSQRQKGIYISYSFLPRYRQLDDFDPMTHQVQVQVFDSWAGGAAAPGKHSGRSKILHWLLWNLPGAKFLCIWHFWCIFGSGVPCRSGAVFRYNSEDEPCTEGQLMT